MSAGGPLRAQRQPGENAAARRSPLVVELVGPAGAGKTAVLRALRHQDKGLRTGIRIDRMRSLPMITRHALTLAPVGLGLIRKSGRWWRSSLQHLLRLRTLGTLLRRPQAGTGHAIVLDEGPVFSLCRLLLFQRRTQGDAALPGEWLQEVAQWAGTIDLVVWLDAPDPILAQRIRDRAKAHQVKDASPAETVQFLQRFRSAYRETLNRLASGGRSVVVAIDTASAPPDHVAAIVLASIRRIERGDESPLGPS